MLSLTLKLVAGWGNGMMLLLTPHESRLDQQESDKIGGLGRYLQRVWLYRHLLTQAMNSIGLNVLDYKD